MLVLSRRPNEKIVFPNLGVTVEVLNVKSRTVRIGVEAPSDVPILRGEIASAGDLVAMAEASAEALKERRHKLRGELNLAKMAACLAQKQLQVGLREDAEKTLAQSLAHFEVLEKTVTLEIAPPPRPSDGKKRKEVLLVEDNANESVLLSSILELSGLQVKTAFDGCEALDYLAEHSRPDAVLMDMKMPRCDGPTTVLAIRRNPKFAGLKIFAVSGTAPAEFGVATGPEGVDGWFGKPLNTNHLMEAMNQIVAAR